MINHPNQYTLESERGSMNNYSETITGNQDCLRNTWVNGDLNHRETAEGTGTLRTALLIFFFFGRRHTSSSLSLKVRAFSVLSNTVQ